MRERRKGRGNILYFEREWCLDDKPQVVASVEFFPIYPGSGKKRATLSILVNVQTRRWGQVLLAVKNGFISTMLGFVGYSVRIGTSASCYLWNLTTAEFFLMTSRMKKKKENAQGILCFTVYYQQHDYLQEIGKEKGIKNFLCKHWTFNVVNSALKDKIGVRIMMLLRYHV